MSKTYTADAWRKECRDADGTTLFYLLGVYVDGNPMCWTDEMIGILRDEINSRRTPTRSAK